MRTPTWRETIRRFIVRTKGEEFFVALKRRSAFLRKIIPARIRQRVGFATLIPPPASYPKDDAYSLVRDKTQFRINRSDYVQWRLFYDVRDNALAEAKRALSSGSIALDVGASFGAFSLRLAAHAAERKLTDVRIHAFEPNPFIYRKYVENLALNPELKVIIHTHPVALGNETGLRSFQYPDLNTGAGRVLQDGLKGRFTVQMQRLDDVLGAFRPARIAFIKLIAGGFEPEVLKGGWETIEKARPPIFFEVTPRWYKENNSSVDEIIEKLRSLNYLFVGQHGNELIPYHPKLFSGLDQYYLLAYVRRQHSVGFN